MGKKSAAQETAAAQGSPLQLASLLATGSAVDPTLASLFAGSSGPVRPPARAHRPETSSPALRKAKDAREGAQLEGESNEDSAESAADEDISMAGASEDEDDSSESVVSNSDEEEVDVDVDVVVPTTTESTKSRKRKRNDEDNDNLEDAYLGKLARQEEKETARRQAGRAEKASAIPAQINSDDESASEVDSASEEDDNDDGDEGEADAEGDYSEEEFELPQHETLAPSHKDQELEKASRTVFLGNVSTEAISSKTAKKTLVKHLSSFIPSLAPQKPPHKVESLRFRSTPFASAIPKKAAFAKKELMDATTKSTNAYVVYSTQLAAREAAKRLNGTVVLDRHLRVDLVAHPAKTDHRRCVFVGNLGFVDDDTAIREASAAETGKKAKTKTPSDVEEGLWQQFSKAGPVESVRVVRDAKTRVGKGFAYVQFEDENSVEAALLFNDKKFPPMLPRALRVIRAKAVKRKDVRKKVATGTSSNGIYNPKQSASEQSYLGRTKRLLGNAGASIARSASSTGQSGDKSSGGGMKKPEAFVFEGHRASAKQGKTGFKFKKSKNKAGKLQNRSSRRASAWKAAGGKKQ